MIAGKLEATRVDGCYARDFMHPTYNVTYISGVPALQQPHIKVLEISNVICVN